MLDADFAHIKKLYEFELYESVLPLGSIILSAYKNDRSCLQPVQHFYTLAYCAFSFFHERNYRSAANFFNLAIMALRELRRHSKSLAEICGKEFPEYELRYQHAICAVNIKMEDKAIQLLQYIPQAERAPKVSMLLAKLLRNSGKTRAAISAYRDALAICPVNMVAMRDMIQLGEKGVDVNSLIVDATLSPLSAQWIPNWIQAHDYIQTSKFSQAIESLKVIEKTIIRNNESIVSLIGQCHYFNGDYSCALPYLIRAENINPYFTDGLMALANIFAKKDRLEDLSKRTMQPMLVSELKSEHWTVFALHMLCHGKLDKAALFAQKACFLNSRNVDVWILKAKVLREMKRPNEAINHLRHAMLIAPNRFEIYKGLVHMYVINQRLREAQSVAASAAVQFGDSPRTFALRAHSFIKDNFFRYKTKELVLRALEMDNRYMPGVLLLVQLCREVGDNHTAIRYLRKHVGINENAKIHCVLAEILNAEKDTAGAMEHYKKAIILDPTNRQAFQALLEFGEFPDTPPASSARKSSIVQAAGSQNEDRPFFRGSSFDADELAIVDPTDTEGDSETPWSDLELDIGTGSVL